MQKNIVFEAKNIVKRFGRSTALRGINLQVAEGDFISIFGANGVGKTTFLKISAKLLSPSEGEIFFKGKNINEAGNAARKEIGFIAHDTFLYRSLTARENLRFYGRMYQTPELDSVIDSTLKSVGLYERGDDLITGFSRGMQQRLTIARAFLHNPTILLLDEPYTGLDRAASEILNGLIKSFYSSKNAGIMTTHNLDQGYDIASHVVVMNKGKVEFISATKDISKKDFGEIYMKIVS